MTEIHLTLNNFNDFDQLFSLFPESKAYEFTSKKVFRQKMRIHCDCGSEMVHNGYDFVRKKGFGKAKIGKQLCPDCGKQHHEDKGFWKNILGKWKDAITNLIMLLRDSDVSWMKISELMNYIVPING